MQTIWMVDADLCHSQSLEKGLGDLGLHVKLLKAWPVGSEGELHDTPDLVLVADDLFGTDILDILGFCASKAPVVVMSKHLIPDRMIECVASGAYDVLAKPVSLKQIAQLCQNVEREMRVSDRCLPQKRGLGNAVQMIIGSGPSMIDVLKTAGLVAKTDATVLIRGESGTGKELFAREIHRVSGRSGKFVALNCAAIAEGLAESELFGHEKGAFTGALGQRAGCFEQAQNGTIFLDEIGDATPAFQAKLLRALDHGEFVRVGGHVPICTNARVVAATNRDLEDMVANGDFRLDLYYRLGAMTLSLPALRERREDIPEVVQVLLDRLNRHLGCRVKGITEEALEMLVGYDWPGNMRELQHVIHRAVLICRGNIILPSHLEGVTPCEGATGNGIPTLAEIEEEHIKKVLDMTGGNRGRSCQLLGISRPTLRRKIRHYKLLPIWEEDLIQA